MAGDTVLIKGRRGRETVCVVVPEEKMEEDQIALPKNALDWLRVLLCVCIPMYIPIYIYLYIYLYRVLLCAWM